MTSIGGGAFEGCSGFTGPLTIPNTVTSIDGYAFHGCSGFTGDLTIPNSVTSIELGAFKGCSGFTGALTIPDSMTIIKWESFRDCSGFTGALTIGNNVTSIEQGAFSGCNKFTSVRIFATTPPKVREVPGETLNTGIPLIVLEGSLEEYKKHSYWEKFASISGHPTTDSYELSADSTTLRRWKGKQNAIDMQADIILKKIKHIAENAFANPNGGSNGDSGKNYDENKTLKTIVLPEGLETIGDHAFVKCTTLSGNLTIPNTVTSIGVHAFRESAFSGTLTIPNSVKTLATGAFAYCSGFSDLAIGNSLKKISDYAFYKCSELTGDLKIGEKIEEIGKEAFYQCAKLNGTLTIGKNLKKIGEKAFVDCPFTTIRILATIPPTVQKDNAGLNTTLSLTVPEGSLKEYEKHSYWNKFASIKEYYITDSCELSEDSTTLLRWKGDEETIDMQANKILKKIKHIAENAFAKPNGGNNKDSGKNYDENKTLKTIVFPEGLETIGDHAFVHCTALSGDLIIPNSVKSIEKNAFRGCSGFRGALTIGKNVTSIGQAAFYGCSGFAGALTIGNSVTSIGDYAFGGCSGFTGDLTIPNGATSIGRSAFQGCSGFKGTLTIPNSVTSIGRSAFQGCSGFKRTLTIPNSVTSIGGWAFFKCYGFTGALTIPNSVTSIGERAFEDCLGLAGTLTIGNSVTKIGESAFAGCYKFTSGRILSTTPPGVTNSEPGLNTALPLTVPEGSLEEYKKHDYWKKFASITDVAAPSSINKVEATANELRFYPSPVKNLLAVDCEKAIEAYALYSGTGVLLQSKKTKGKELQIDMENYPSGIYFLRLLSKEGTKTIKLIKK